jgi:hypothetical protein
VVYKDPYDFEKMLFEQLGLASIENVEVTGSGGSGTLAGQEGDDNVEVYFTIDYTLTAFHQNTAT